MIGAKRDFEMESVEPRVLLSTLRLIGAANFLLGFVVLAAIIRDGTGPYIDGDRRRWMTRLMAAVMAMVLGVLMMRRRSKARGLVLLSVAAYVLWCLVD
jgi:hypothetical protein